MADNGELRAIRGGIKIFRVTTPFAQSHNLDTWEVLFEEHAYTILSHFTALEFHGLTQEQPKLITAISAAKAIPDVLPLGTDASDWEHLSLPSRTRPGAVSGQLVRWTTVELARIYGYSVYRPLGVPYRVTSPERTLMDALQKPELCGGIANVLKAWVAGRDMIDPILVEQYTERYNVALLRQRVGYVLEALGFASQTLNCWAQSSKRGGSSKLVGSEPFASDHSERWNLSLNAPVHILHELVII